MSFEELIVSARINELRRDIARWERGESALAELRAAEPQSKSRFRIRPRRRAWSLNRELGD